MSTLFERLKHSFRDKDYRQVYTEGFCDSKIATQIKVLREQRGWTQAQLAEAADMKQSRIAALEDVNYSSWSIRTLRRLAQAFDLWLDVEFKEFGALWPQLQNFSRESLVHYAFEDDPVFKDGNNGQKRAIQDNIVDATNSAPIASKQKSEGIGGSALSSIPHRQPFEQRGFSDGIQLSTVQIRRSSAVQGGGLEEKSYGAQSPGRGQSVLAAIGESH